MGELRADGPRRWNASALHAALLESSALLAMGDARARARGGDRRATEGRSQDSARARPGCAGWRDRVRELAQALRLARLGALRLARRAGADTPDDAALARELAAAIEEQRACWLVRARPGGLGDSVARSEGAQAGLRA